MLRPFVAYLRVYEPLSSFGDPPPNWLLRAASKAKLTRETVGEHEQRMWFNSQFSDFKTLLPAELEDGTAAPENDIDVLVLDPASLSPGEGPELGPELLVCPLQLRARSAAAMINFLGNAEPALLGSVLSVADLSADAARARMSTVLSELDKPVVHVLSTTWTVPLPWFALIDPEHRRFKLGTGRDDPHRELSWRVTMFEALRRVDDALELIQRTLGDSGPARVLADTKTWLKNFHPGSALELDYGGLVQAIPDELLAQDSSAEDVHGVLEALRERRMEDLSPLFTRLREYWGQLANYEHLN